MIRAFLAGITAGAVITALLASPWWVLSALALYAVACIWQWDRSNEARRIAAARARTGTERSHIRLIKEER